MILLISAAKRDKQKFRKTQADSDTMERWSTSTLRSETTNAAGGSNTEDTKAEEPETKRCVQVSSGVKTNKITNFDVEPGRFPSLLERTTVESLFYQGLPTRD